MPNRLISNSMQYQCQTMANPHPHTHVQIFHNWHQYCFNANAVPTLLHSWHQYCLAIIVPSGEATLLHNCHNVCLCNNCAKIVTALIQWWRTCATPHRVPASVMSYASI